MNEEIETEDVTEQATAAGWTLPDGWRVTAHLFHDVDILKPADHGDSYAVDFDVPDYSDPTKGFCKHCDRVIMRGKEVWYEGTRVDCPDNDEDDAAWVTCETCTGYGWVPVDGSDEEIDCTVCPATGGWPGHELAESKAMQWWRRDEWAFGLVAVQVRDDHDRPWGVGDSMGGTEYGSFPIVAEDGTVTSIQLEPLDIEPGEYSVIVEHDMIDAALRSAMEELVEFGTPKITAPRIPADTPTLVARVKAEIMQDIASGQMPATVASWGELHDHVDANEYGGLCDPDDPNSDITYEASTPMHDQVDAWLRAGRPTA